MIYNKRCQTYTIRTEEAIILGVSQHVKIRAIFHTKLLNSNQSWPIER